MTGIDPLLERNRRFAGTDAREGVTMLAKHRCTSSLASTPAPTPPPSSPWNSATRW